VAFEVGNLADAVADLDRDRVGLECRASFNRAAVHEAMGHWTQAEADFCQVID